MFEETKTDGIRERFLASIKQDSFIALYDRPIEEKAALIAPKNDILTPYGSTAYVDYAQLYANTHNEQIKEYQEDQKNTFIPGMVPACSMGFVRGICTGGHQFAKMLLCGREWCKDCGADNSYAHQRRMARWFPKVMQMQTFGYLVITVPEQLREASKNKKFLTDFRTYTKRKLQRLGYDRGLIRYHWAGEDGAKWHPHLNILIEETFLPPDKLKKIKNDLRSWFERRHPETFKKNRAKINLWYNYVKPNTPTFDNHKVHKLKYVTRATLKVYNAELAKVIKGFRTTSQWGKWKKPDEKNNSSLISLVQNICPHKTCRKPVKWEGGRDKIFSKKFLKDFKKVILMPLEGGYYEIAGKLPDKPPPSDFSDPKKADSTAIQGEAVHIKNYASIVYNKIQAKNDLFVIVNPDIRSDEEKEAENKIIEDSNRFWQAKKMENNRKKYYNDFINEKN